MKIGIDARFYRSSTGGIGRYTRALLRELAIIDKNNQYIIYITPEDKNEFNINAKNFKVKIVPVKHYSFQEQTTFLKILNQDKLDLVHFTNFNHPLFYKGDYIITIHDLTILFYPTKKIKKSILGKIAYKKIMQSAINDSKKIIAISKATKNDLTKHLNAKSNKIEVIYEGIDNVYREIIKPEKLEEFKLKNNLDFPYILFVSQWRPHKGLPELIKAFNILKTNYKIPHKLIIVGKPNNDFPNIIESINNSKYINDIIKPGFIEEKDLPFYYACADIFVFPSFYEGFGLPPLEAMAKGTPVAASNVSCIPEILKNGAIYFDPNNPEDIAKSINNLIINNNIRKKIIEAGKKQADKYSWELMAKKTLKLYLEYA